MDAITILAQLLARATPISVPASVPLHTSQELTAIMRLLQSLSTVSGSAPQNISGGQMRHDASMLVRCIVLDCATGQPSTPTAYRVVSIMGDVSFEGLVEVVTSRLGFSKLPGRRLRSVQACGTDGVQVVIDDDVAVRYLLDLLKKGNNVTMTVYAVDTILVCIGTNPREMQKPASPATVAAFDASATPLYHRGGRTLSPSVSPPYQASLDDTRGRSRQRTPARNRFSDDRSASPAAHPQEPARDRGYESTPRLTVSPRCQTPSPSTISVRRISRTYDSLPRDEGGERDVLCPSDGQGSPTLSRGSFHAPLLPAINSSAHRREWPGPELPSYCAISISEAGRNEYRHFVVENLRLRLATVNKFQQGWGHVLNELFARKPESEQNPDSLFVEREEGKSTVMMLFIRVKGRPQNSAVYDTAGDLGIIINPKAMLSNSCKWTNSPNGTILLRFTTDGSFPVINKNTDPVKDPYSQGPQTNGMNHIAVNFDNAPLERIEQPNYKALSALLESLRSGKDLDVVIEATSSRLPPDPPSLLRNLLGAQRDDRLVFHRGAPLVIEKEEKPWSKGGDKDRKREMAYDQDRQSDHGRYFGRDGPYDRPPHSKKRPRGGDIYLMRSGRDNGSFPGRRRKRQRPNLGA
ncbi:hypothetical protein TWF730_011027 [Orbilia blumenaviensis]|uniref:Uncharacterized protein n=1 Tax=Orbilia blumenaviensis TaxID=1796055 RepID=A0AAV9UKP5_9PEZI